MNNRAAKRKRTRRRFGCSIFNGETLTDACGVRTKHIGKNTLVNNSKQLTYQRVSNVVMKLLLLDGGKYSN